MRIGIATRPVRLRSLLFLPAINQRAIAKARESGADLVILDLEDAVKAEDKGRARAAADRGGGRTMADAGRNPDQHSRTRMAWRRHGRRHASAKPDVIVVPRAEGKEEVGFVRNQTGQAGRCHDRDGQGT